MLEKFELINGQMTEPFRSDKYEYEVSVDSDVLTLLFNYQISGDATINVYGNDELTLGENHIWIDVATDKVTTYTFTVNKEVDKEVLKTNDNTKTIEVSARSEFLHQMITPLIGTTTFLLIVVLFCIIFRKK